MCVHISVSRWTRNKLDLKVFSEDGHLLHKEALVARGRQELHLLHAVSLGENQAHQELIS